jgi:hypothetical protein
MDTFHLQHFKFLGHVLAKSILIKVPISVNFPCAMLKFFFKNKSFYIEDIEPLIDSSTYLSIKWILDNKISEEDADYYFTLDFSFLLILTYLNLKFIY